MAIGGGEREISARGMVDPDEGGVGDKIVGLGAAVIGMGAPGNVGQQAGGVPQTPIVLVFLEVRRRKQPARPIEKLLAVRRRARAQAVEFPGRVDQGVLVLRLRRKLRIKRPSRTPSAEMTISFGLACRMISSSTAAP